MNLRIRLLPILALALSLSAHAAEDSSSPKSPSPVAVELQNIVEKTSVEIKAGKRSAADLAPAIAELDSLLARYPEKNEDTAQVALAKAMLYLRVFRDEEAGKRMLSDIQTNYPGTRTAKKAKAFLFRESPEGKAQAAAKEAERKANLAAIVGQPAPELHFMWSSQEGLETLSDLQGQVVVLDFWATWCGPCIRSFPQIREHVSHFENDPVTFLGVTSIQGRVSNMGETINTRGDEARELELMDQFMELKDMTWDVVFSEERVFNPQYFIKGIPYVAIIAPDGTVRHAGLHPGSARSDIAGKIQALLEEFDLAKPSS